MSNLVFVLIAEKATHEHLFEWEIINSEPIETGQENLKQRKHSPIVTSILKNRSLLESMEPTLMSPRKTMGDLVFSSHLDDSVEGNSIMNSKVFYTKVRGFVTNPHSLLA